MIHLDKTQLTLVKQILRAHLPERRIAAFGSRVQGTARQFSDLDLLVLGDEPVASEVLSELRYAFAESDLSISVDVVEWATLSPSFRRVIERTPVAIVQEPAVPAPLTVE
jgi:predicted nucleotidyltransferase